MTAMPATLDDGSLIKLAIEGQDECFSILMDRHLTAVRRQIGSIVRNPTDADDILQEASLKAWRHLATFRSECSFRTWIIRVAINEVWQLHRRERRRPVCQAFTDFDTFSSDIESPHESFARVETTQAVRSAVGSLPAKYSRVLILRDLRELSIKETAQWVSSNIPAVKTRVSRGRQLLATALQRSRIRGLASARA